MIRTDLYIGAGPNRLFPEGVEIIRLISNFESIELESTIGINLESEILSELDLVSTVYDYI